MNGTTKPLPMIEAPFSEHVPAPESAEQAVQRLANLSPLEYEGVRVAEAERLKFRATVLDAEVKKARETYAEKPKGRVLLLEPPKPWEQPVRTGDVLDALANALDRHLVLTPAARDVIAL